MEKLPYVFVFVALSLVYVPRLFVSRAQAKLPEGYDNAHPRDQQARLEGAGRRAQAAHLNGFEAFPAFAAGMLGSRFAGVDLRVLAALGAAFVVARALYVWFYIANRPAARSTVWTVGFVATGLLLLLPAFR